MLTVKTTSQEPDKPDMATRNAFRAKGIKDFFLKKSIKIFLSCILYYSGFLWIYEEIFSKTNLRILTYHSIDKISFTCLEMEQSPENFKQQMEYLHKNYNIISLPQFLAFRKNGHCLPPKSVLITFDDGYRDNFLNAYPILRALDMPAAIFIAPRFIDNLEVFYFDVIRHGIYRKAGETIDLREFDLGLHFLWNNELYLVSVINFLTTALKGLDANLRQQKLAGICRRLDYDPRELTKKKIYLDWADVLEMSRNGIEFGSHSLSHAHLASSPANDLRNELSHSKQIIEEKLGKEIQTLAYPFGSRDAYNQGVAQQARKASYEVAFSLNSNDCDLSSFTIGRKTVDSHATTNLRGKFCKPLFAAELAMACPVLRLSIARPQKVKNRINILYIIDQFHAGGGTERHLSYLTTQLDRKKFAPYLVVFDLKNNPLIEKIQNSGIPIYHVQVRKYYSPNAFKKAFHLRKIIKENQIDMVQTFHYKADTYGAIISYLTGIKKIVSSKRDTGDLKKKKHFFLHRVCNHFINNFIFVSNAVRGVVSQREHISNKRTKTICNGIDPTKFSPPDKAAKQASRTKFNILEKDFVIGMVAWLRPEKNHPVLFEAIQLAKNTIPNCKLLVVGGGTLLEPYQKLTKEMGLAGQVIFTGPCDAPTVRELLAIMDLACLIPGGNEGFSNSVLEKMAMGLPVIVSDVGGNAEAVADGYNGLVIPPNDSAGLARAIIALYQDEDLRRKMGSNSRQRVEEKFSLAFMIKEHECFYEEIMERPPATDRNSIQS